MHTREQLKEDLMKLGIQKGDKLLIHSSYKSLGGIEGGAAGFFETVVEVLGEEGTLIIPTLSFATVGFDQPYFDVKTTPSCVGYLTEYFRTQFPGVVRSLHASHSCAVYGKDAAEWVKDHELDLTPVGEHSPFTRLSQAGGKILMLGCNPGNNTSMHGVEEAAEVPYMFEPDRKVHYEITDADGRVIVQDAYRHGHARADVVYHAKYIRILDLLAEDEITRGKVLDADCILMSAAAVWEKGVEAMRKDPFYFVDAVRR